MAIRDKPDVPPHPPLRRIAPMLLTFGVGSGVLLNQHAHETPWRWSAHEITSLVAWAILLGELLLRMTSGWRGRHTAVLNIFGFAVTMATLVAGFVGMP